MKRILAFFMFLILICGFTVRAEEIKEPTNLNVQAEKIEEPKNLYAQAAVLMDAKSGRILFEKNGNQVLANASTTKILTCILALEKGNLEDTVIASEKASAQPRVHLGMQTGEQFFLKDLLYSLMLESHNDSAVAIADIIPRRIKKGKQSAKRVQSKLYILSMFHKSQCVLSLYGKNFGG